MFVLIMIQRELKQLKKHHDALRSHEQQLQEARPLISTIYTNKEEIMRIAIDFTNKANYIYAQGSISSLLETERMQDESQVSFQDRLAVVDPDQKLYVKSTSDKICNGIDYRRIMDFMPENNSDASIAEIYANVKFFIRVYDMPNNGEINLKLYHNSEVTSGRGEFHFRFSDQMLVLRVGGHGNSLTNAAITINDARVISEFKKYFDSLVDSPKTKRLELKDLQVIDKFLQAKDLENLRNFLNSNAEDTIVEHIKSYEDTTHQILSGDSSVNKRSSAIPVAVLLAAGQGSRMGPIAQNQQKCMLNVLDKPLLQWNLDIANNHGIDHIIILTRHKAEDVRRFVSHLDYASKIEIIDTGANTTAESLYNIRSKLSDEFLYMHGNIIIPERLVDIMEKAFEEYKNDTGTNPSAILATVSNKSNLTHAVLKRTKPGQVSIIKARKWTSNDKNIHLRSRNRLLSLGIGILSKANLDWSLAHQDGLMIEGLISYSNDNPILNINISSFAHIETEADLRRIESNYQRLQSITKSLDQL